MTHINFHDPWQLAAFSFAIIAILEGMALLHALSLLARRR